ncbi:NADP-dependent phosphogluconate dehydrogenase [Rhabdobacter roseus]|uniref:6-phosphogluconate dehydrogenase, decarboxylating n=1 Tax=Rhabdobacter roseus TaxID=1655419 RepID=A0A840U044_9BACT|nr:NADP-dependent phosphogluconate dehydrogenase [Rhabdobacter roseus]MBB5286913.1 6-phosphogluconate dehydrogenase [Rhabdobacter roseus]
MATQTYDYGMVGLGTMGRNLVFNMSDHGFSVVGFDKDKAKGDALEQDATGAGEVLGADNLEVFLAALKVPRTILILVPAGPAVDAVIRDLTPHLSPEDLLIDCGNSNYRETNRRIEQLAKQNIHFMGVGISGGELGARFGPSIMPGGDPEAYERVAPLLEAIAAKVNAEPCVTYIGARSAGHYVKMVHNGIEYALMQLIAEFYHIMKEVVGMDNTALQHTFSEWNKGPLQSFLIEITADIFAQKDELTSGFLIDRILDQAHQKGTGMWTSQDAMQLHVPITTIDAAVSMRDVSSYKEERQAAEQYLKGPDLTTHANPDELPELLAEAFYFAMIITYAQGMALLHHASQSYEYNTRLDRVASIWRGGCIIRATLLEKIRAAFEEQPDLSNLLVSNTFAPELNRLQTSARLVAKTSLETGVPVPALMASLSYFDSYRRGWLPANLIQAQRDYFGAHTYERNDREGIFHTQWNPIPEE